MRRESKSVLAGRLALALVVALTAVLTPMPPPARAQAATEAVYEEAGTTGEIERWWGAAGALLCGLEIRMIVRYPAIGMNPYALAAGIAGCSLAMLDVLTTE